MWSNVDSNSEYLPGAGGERYSPNAPALLWEWPGTAAGGLRTQFTIYEEVRGGKKDLQQSLHVG